MCGAITSLAIIYVTILFGSLKLQHLTNKKGPTINTNITPLEAGVTYKIDQDEFMMAFSAENYETNEPLTDPRYVKWVTAYWERVGGKLLTRFYPMHKCSDAEFSRFSKPENDLTATKVNKL